MKSAFSWQRNMPRKILLVAVLFLSYSLVHAQEQLPSPSPTGLNGSTFTWTAVDNAIGYLVSWGPDDGEINAEWLDDPGQAEGSARLPASQTQYTLDGVAICGWWLVQVQALGDGVNYASSGGAGLGRYRECRGIASSGAGGNRNAARVKPKPPVYTCANLPGHVIVSSDSMGVQCQIVGLAGIGVPSIINAGVLAAVDVWGPLGVDAEVCFASSGSMTFLDATTSPRTQMSPAYYSRDGLTCTRISHPGTVILMPAALPDDMGADDAGNMDAAVINRDDNRDSLLIPDSIDTMVDLENCQVTLRYNLNFRDAPAGRKISVMPSGVTKIALARTENWFKVEYDDVEGWITAHYVNGDGDCG